MTDEVASALASGRPVVALESTIVAHGFPRPTNAQIAADMVRSVSDEGAVAAIVAVVDGEPRCGLSALEIERLSNSGAFEKCAARDVGKIVAAGGCGATTVSATCLIAAQAGIEVFATGGIGGVHRNAATTFDVSADLSALARWPVLVVSAGAKAILDLPATVEHLETLSVPVVGYKTNRFPAFYARDSGIELSWRCDDAASIAHAWRWQRQLGGLLVVNPVPKADEIDPEAMQRWIADALKTAHEHRIIGRALTPFLLSQLVSISNGRTLHANRSLAIANAALAAKIATAISTLEAT